MWRTVFKFFGGEKLSSQLIRYTRQYKTASIKQASLVQIRIIIATNNPQKKWVQYTTTTTTNNTNNNYYNNYNNALAFDLLLRPRKRLRDISFNIKKLRSDSNWLFHS